MSVITENRRQVPVAREVKDKSRRVDVRLGQLSCKRWPKWSSFWLLPFFAISDVSVIVGGSKWSIWLTRLDSLTSSS
jgi:hypothetical protein